MKRTGLFLVTVFLITSGTFFQRVTAQEKTKEEQEKEFNIQKTIELQKKAMNEQKKAQEKALEKLQENQIELDKSLRDIEVNVDVNSEDQADHTLRGLRRKGNRSFYFNEPFDVNVSTGIDRFYTVFGSDNESTTWEFSKSVKENTFSREYGFDVEKTANTVVMSVMGDCKAGEIRIRIVMPNGKTYSDVVIDEFGNLNWRKSFTISETENKDKAGEWKFHINSTKATGYFKISLQTY